MATETEFIALTADQENRLWEGGNITGVPVSCDYCDGPAVWSSVRKGNMWTACSNAAHIAWACSIGSACPVSDITPEHFPVDPATCPPAPPPGYVVYAENDGTFTTERDPFTCCGCGGVRWIVCDKPATWTTVTGVAPGLEHKLCDEHRAAVTERWLVIPEDMKPYEAPDGER
jgi:hypothetical protein